MLDTGPALGYRHLIFRKSFIRDPEAVHGGRYSGIDHDLQKHFADLGRGHPIGQRAANVGQQIFGKLNVHRRLQAVISARAAGLIH